MLRRLKLALGCLAVAGLGVANVQIARANWIGDDEAVHRWKSWHWDKSSIGTWVQSNRPFATQARQARDDWHSMTDISLPLRSSHTDISVYAANYGDTGWSGLASVEDNGWDWHCWWYCRIVHGHARVNTFFAGGNTWFARGIHCQEIGHLFGLDHNDRGGCMGLTYFPGSTNRPSTHDVADVNRMY